MGLIIGKVISITKNGFGNSINPLQPDDVLERVLNIQYVFIIFGTE